jgi:hypothetical protein
MKRLWTALDKKGRVLAVSQKPEELITFVRRLSAWAYRRLLAIHGE